MCVSVCAYFTVINAERVPRTRRTVHELRLRADGPVPRYAGGRGRPQRVSGPGRRRRSTG